VDCFFSVAVRAATVFFWLGEDKEEFQKLLQKMKDARFRSISWLMGAFGETELMSFSPIHQEDQLQNQLVNEPKD
jgi:hypothetical protein